MIYRVFVILFLASSGEMLRAAAAPTQTPQKPAATPPTTPSASPSIFNFFGDTLNNIPAPTPPTAPTTPVTPPSTTTPQTAPTATSAPQTTPSRPETSQQAQQVGQPAQIIPQTYTSGTIPAAIAAPAADATKEQPAPQTYTSSTTPPNQAPSSPPAAPPAAGGTPSKAPEKSEAPGPQPSTPPSKGPQGPGAGGAPEKQLEKSSATEQSLLPHEAKSTQKVVSRLAGTPLEQVQLQHHPSLITASKPSEATETPLTQSVGYLGSYVEPWRNAPRDDEIEFFFENAELTALLWYIEEKFNITFILDDIIKPLPQGSKSILGTKISFKTHKPLTRQEAWNIFVTILDMAGVSPVPGPAPRTYRLLPSRDPKAPQDATRSPIPLFIGVDASLLPDDNTIIRYVYYVEHANLNAMRAAADALRSASSPDIILFTDLNALIITDRARNIRSMLALLKELDQVNAQEVLRIVKLKYTDAEKAAKVYEALTKKEAAQGIARIIGSNKSSIADYFSRATRMIPDARANTLIVLAPRVAIDAVERFIVEYVDVPDRRPDEPRYIYRLKFLDAKAVETILQEVLKFKADSAAAKAGGVRDGDKYFRQVSVIAEPTTNSLIISGEYDDYVKVQTLLDSIDIEQPQVALKVFLLAVDLSENKAFGIQMRNKIPGVNGLLGNNVNFQTSGFAAANPATAGSIQENPNPPGAQRLLGNLINLASSATIGSTLITLGKDVYGVWGVLGMLETYTKTEILDNPFLITTNKFPAKFSLGESRRVSQSTIFSGTTSQDAFMSLDANLTVKITPQISRDGLITLDIYIGLKQFIDQNVNSTSGDYTDRNVQTTAIVRNHEVLALGGLIRETVTESTSKVPILGSIPILGWLFKNRNKVIQRTSLLILILPEIIQPAPRSEEAYVFTRDRVRQALDTTDEIQARDDLRDPIQRWFFRDNENQDQAFVDRFQHMGKAYIHESEKSYAQAVEKLNSKLPPLEMTHTEAAQLNNQQTQHHQKREAMLGHEYRMEAEAHVKERLARQGQTNSSAETPRLDTETEDVSEGS